jgi:gliding motility associated protien GldN
MSKQIYRVSFIVLTLVLFANTTFSQVLDPSDDGIIPMESKHFKNNRVVPYPHLRQDDMLWSERHWERIDLREKINLSLYYPERALPGRKSLWNVLVDGIIDENTITEVFEDDKFEAPLTATELASRITSYDTLTDPDDPTIVLAINETKIQSVHVVAYLLKSDWYFDKQRGELKNRIIGIAPQVQDPDNPSRIYEPFWVWFPDARYALATSVAYNEKNNNQRLTFDQIMHLRKFNAVITKMDNVYDRTIADYKSNNAMNQLLEAAAIKEDLRNKEHDMWTF